jgi:hypothetical protein
MPLVEIRGDPFKRMLAVLTEEDRFTVLFTYEPHAASRYNLTIEDFVDDLVERVKIIRNLYVYKISISSPFHT